MQTLSSSSPLTPFTIQSVCVIGAGPSGLSTLNAFTRKALSTEHTPTDRPPVPNTADPVRSALSVQLVCFDKQPDLGGLWRYDWRTATDSHGEPVHNSMYRQLWTNTPKECIEMADYHYDEHFGRPVPSYATRPVILRYLTARADRSQVRRYIRFSSVVQWVEWRPDLFKFAVTVCDHDPTVNSATVDDPDVRENVPIVGDYRTKETGPRVYTVLFDRVVVGTGHFSIPHIPDLPGIMNFRGRVLHSNALREATIYKGKSVLCVGACVSGEDVACQAIKFGARNAILSYRSYAPIYDWPPQIDVQPLVEFISPDGEVQFINGQKRQVDMIVFCTGYRYQFPFLAPKLRLSQEGNAFVTEQLFHGVVWPPRRELYYIGMQNQWFSLNMFDVQAAYIRDLILSRNAPLDGISCETMDADTESWVTRCRNMTELKDGWELQAEYIKFLLEKIDDYPLTAEQLDGICKHLEVVAEQKQASPHGILTFRDRRFTSVMTGTMASEKNKTWMESLEDSEESFNVLVADGLKEKASSDM